MLPRRRELPPEVGCPYHDELSSTTCCVALVVLWMGLHQEKFPLLATSLQAAAGVVGHQRWALILPSSARVSLVTYTAVIAVRYPELDNVQNDLVCFGNDLLGEQATAQSKQNGRHLWQLRMGPGTLCNVVTPAEFFFLLHSRASDQALSVIEV